MYVGVTEVWLGHLDSQPML